MKRLIIKSILITLLLLICIFSLIIGIMVSFYPNKVANLMFRVNNIEKCVKYSEKQYNKSSNVEDLAILTERCIILDDSKKIIFYAEKLITDKNYESLLENKDKDYNYYIVSNLTMQLYINNQVDKSMEVSFNNTKSFGGYTPVHTLIGLAITKNDVTTLQKILAKLEEISPKNADIDYLIEKINIYI